MSTSEDEIVEQQAQRHELEKVCAGIGRQIAEAIENGRGHSKCRLGFTLLMFDFGAKGSLAYTSNANREDMIRLLTEAVQELKERTQ